VGTAHLLGGGFARAIKSHEQALAQLTSAQLAAGNDSLFRYELAITINHLVRARTAEFVNRRTRRGPRRPNQETEVVSPPEIDAEYQQARTLLAELLAESPGNVEFRRALAHCHRSVLPVAWANGDERLASTAKQESVTILRKLVDEYVDNAQYQFDLADTLAMTKYADSGTPLSKTDVEGLQESVALANQLHKKFSTALEYTVLLANTHHKLASHFIAAKNWSDAEPNLAATVGLFESLVASSPSHPLFQVELARARWKLGEGYRRNGSLEVSRQTLEKAIGDYQEFQTSESGRKSSVGLLVGLYRQLARTLEQLGEPDLANEATEMAESFRRPSR
jgi:tetratricopeptide (TPR) repeat protein